MQKIILILILLGLLFRAQCQNSAERPTRTWISIGANFPTGKEFREVHSLGLNSSIYLSLLDSNNFHIGPSLNFNYHVKYLNESARDQLINIGFGLNANYYFTLENTILHLGVAGYYEILNDKISPRKDFEGEDLNILSGSGFSLGPKLSLNHERFIFQFTYLVRKFEIEFDQMVTSPFTSTNQLYEIFSVRKNTKMNFSSLTISVGYEL